MTVTSSRTLLGLCMTRHIRLCKQESFHMGFKPPQSDHKERDRDATLSTSLIRSNRSLEGRRTTNETSAVRGDIPISQYDCPIAPNARRDRTAYPKATTKKCFSRSGVPGISTMGYLSPQLTHGSRAKQISNTEASGARGGRTTYV
jgi:hypothetical protein